MQHQQQYHNPSFANDLASVDAGVTSLREFAQLLQEITSSVDQVAEVSSGSDNGF